MKSDFNYYDLLGLESTATSDQIKAAYRLAVARYHPDVNTAPNAERLTALLNEAWSILRDPTKRAEYDGRLRFNDSATDDPPQVWEVLVCERCGQEDAHLRFAIFYLVWSAIFFCKMTPTAALLCVGCRSRQSTASALFSALLGPWGFPWGILYTIKALYIAAIGGSLDRDTNAAMLLHLAVAYSQRGRYDAAATALTASLKFRPNPHATDFLREVENAGGHALGGPAWLRGQTFAVASSTIPFIGLYLLIMWLGTGSSVPATQTGTDTATSIPTHAPNPYAKKCADAEFARTPNLGNVYSTCLKASTFYDRSARIAKSPAARDLSRNDAAFYKIFAATGASSVQEYQRLRRDALETWKDLASNAGDPRLRTFARAEIDCSNGNKKACATVFK